MSTAARLCKLSSGLVLLAATAGCIGSPEPGEWGNFRYAGQVRGSTPLLLLPPLSDRDGNAYVAYGSVNTLELDLFIGGLAGGWNSCGAFLSDTALGNDFGVHGFVGRAQNAAWLWTGDGLVRASGISGACSRVLEFAPSSNARLAFRAVVPWVRDTPSRTTTLAYIQAPLDPRPFTVVIDLERNIYTNIEEFEPNSATEVEVLGVGGNLSRAEGVIVVRYRVGDSVYTQARFIDHLGVETERVSLSGLDTIPEYGIVGYIQGDDEGLYAGLDVEGQLLVLDASEGRRRSVPDMDTPVGVHRWESKLYVVGESGGTARLLPIEADGDLGDAFSWDSSDEAEDNLGKSIDVIDDRSLPSQDTTWNAPRTAMGNNIFVHPHSLDHYADGTTNWLVAGPSYSAGGEDRTAIAYAPVGIRYE